MYFIQWVFYCIDCIVLQFRPIPFTCVCKSTVQLNKFKVHYGHFLHESPKMDQHSCIPFNGEEGMVGWESSLYQFIMDCVLGVYFHWTIVCFYILFVLTVMNDDRSDIFNYLVIGILVVLFGKNVCKQFLLVNYACRHNPCQFSLDF